ncbi:protein Wnt-5b-like [Watersipora subatra]|uniref:protein Wnt-5b-like n=1 Tax=Watersipora subatra TaxID=2589382 RepID=UPI00355B9B4C
MRRKEQSDISTTLIYLLSLVSCILNQVSAQAWQSSLMAWQLNPQLYLLGAAPKCTAAKARLSPLQNAMCTNAGYMDHMSSVNVGLLLALNECQHQFSNSKWNCTSVELEFMLEGIKDIEASKEDAFLHAATAAGIAHAIARGCRNGLISKCSCSNMERPENLNMDWEWGGCGDNVNYGQQFATAFVDLREKESNHPKGSESLALTLMNKHNNEAGRRTVSKEDQVTCKCHGVSGSCSLKTCWQELSPFRTIGDKLKKNYDIAMQVGFNKDGTGLRNRIKSKRSKRRASKEELIYMKESKNVCMRNSNGELPDNMVGRRCNITSSGEDNCETLCCGRGSVKKVVTVTERCNCKFQWCCYVECDECSHEEIHDICV